MTVKRLHTEKIGVCVEVNGRIPSDLKNAVDSVTEKFIRDYNKVNNKYELVSCRNDGRKTLYLNILSIEVTNPLTQAAGVVITTAGTIAPIVMKAMDLPVCISFTYLPRSSMQIGMNLSDGLIATDGNGSVKALVSNEKYFGSYSEQKEMLLTGYYDRLRQEMKSIGKNDPEGRVTSGE